jgi:hypothetical protein
MNFTPPRSVAVFHLTAADISPAAKQFACSSDAASLRQAPLSILMMMLVMLLLLITATSS